MKLVTDTLLPQNVFAINNLPDRSRPKLILGPNMFNGPTKAYNGQMYSVDTSETTTNEICHNLHTSHKTSLTLIESEMVTVVSYSHPAREAKEKVAPHHSILLINNNLEKNCLKLEKRFWVLIKCNVKAY